MELLFLLLLIIIMALALGSGFPVAFALLSCVQEGQLVPGEDQVSLGRELSLQR